MEQSLVLFLLHAVQSIWIRLILSLLLLQCPLPVLHVPEQPLEYLYVTMYRYVDVVDGSGIAYVGLEVMHVLPEVVL